MILIQPYIMHQFYFFLILKNLDIGQYYSFKRYYCLYYCLYKTTAIKSYNFIHLQESLITFK